MFARYFDSNVDTDDILLVMAEWDVEDCMRLVTSRNSRIQVMLDQEDDPELNDEWLTANEQLTHFSKSREQIAGRIKGIELPYVQGPQSSVEDLVLRERVPSRT